MGGAGGLDIRLPIGGLFAVLGLVLTGYGVATAGEPAHYARTLSININLWWGLVMLAFGVGLLLSATFYRGGASGSARGQGRATEEREHRLGLEG
jgi:hypothetical protein